MPVNLIDVLVVLFICCLPFGFNLAGVYKGQPFKDSVTSSENILQGWAVSASSLLFLPLTSTSSDLKHCLAKVQAVIFC